VTRTRGQRLYDRWSDNEWALCRLYDLVFLGRQAEVRARSVDALELTPGDTVLDVGCGTGLSFHRLRTRVGREGRVIGLDYSEGMVRRARRRVRERGWANVAVVRGDATRLPVGGLDAVYASMTVSATPDPGAVAREARRALRPGGRVAALDARPFPDGPWTALNPLLAALFRRTTDWNPGADVPAALADAFGGVSVDEYVGGSVVVAAARRAE